MNDSREASLSTEAIEAVLFDADGVLQSAQPGRRDALAALLPPEDEDVDGFIDEVFEVERPALAGAGGLIADMQALLRRRGSAADASEILRLLAAIHPHSEILDIVARLRESGVRCYVTSNQQRHRAAYMSETLGYRALFDAELYSCDLGHVKPGRAYFERVLDAIRTPPDRVLFLDDHEVNVAGARELGIEASVFQLHRGVDNRRALTEMLLSYGQGPFAAGPDNLVRKALFACAFGIVHAPKIPNAPLPVKAAGRSVQVPVAGAKASGYGAILLDSAPIHTARIRPEPTSKPGDFSIHAHHGPVHRERVA